MDERKPHPDFPNLGAHVEHPHYGEVEFYRYTPIRDKVEVFDKYGILRRLTVKEFHECPRVGTNNRRS